MSIWTLLANKRKLKQQEAVWRAQQYLGELATQYGVELVERLQPRMLKIFQLGLADSSIPQEAEWAFDAAFVNRLFLDAQKEEADESRTAGEDLHGGADPVAGAGATGPVAGPERTAGALDAVLPRPPPPSEPAPELLSEVVIGCRSWRLLDTAAGIHCQSLSASTRWPPRTPLQAECQIVSEHSGLVPSWGCACGLYAWRLDRRPPRGQVVSTGEVTGLVGLWGRVIQHHDGWRGQYGYPLAFFAPPVPPGFPTGGVLATLAERYAVPLISEARDRWPAWLRRGEPLA